MLSTSDLTSMRATQAGNLPDTCSIKRKTAASDGIGGYTRSEATTTASVACRVKTASANERSIASQINTEISHMVTLPYGTDVQERDVIIFGTKRFDVIGVETGSYNTAVRCACMEVT